MKLVFSLQSDFAKNTEAYNEKKILAEAYANPLDRCFALQELTGDTPHQAVARDYRNAIVKHMTAGKYETYDDTFKDSPEPIPAAISLLLIFMPELIKNAYDAGAEKFTIDFDESTQSLSVIDDGEGISDERILAQADTTTGLTDYRRISPDGGRIKSKKADDASKTGGAGAGLAQLQITLNILAARLGITTLLQVGNSTTSKGAVIKIDCSALAPFNTIVTSYQQAKSEQDTSRRLPTPPSFTLPFSLLKKPQVKQLGKRTSASYPGGATSRTVPAPAASEAAAGPGLFIRPHTGTAAQLDDAAPLTKPPKRIRVS